MSTNPFSRDVPLGSYAIPFQRAPGTDAQLEVALITHDQAAEHQTALADLVEAIGWSSRSGEAFPKGRLTVEGTRPSRANIPRLTTGLGSRVAVCANPNAADLIAAWHDYLTRYREVARSLAELSQGRRSKALDEAAAEHERYRGEMEEWAKVYGSGRLLHSLSQGERPQRVYRAERRERELPGFHIDPDASWRAEPLREVSAEAARALGAVETHLAEWDIGHSGCDLVFATDGREENADPRAAVRVAGWLGRHALFGFVSTDGRDGPITADYPDGVRLSSGSALRPTAYGSAYGIRHPAAQEALHHAAIVAVDLFLDGEPKERLKEYLPPDAHDLIDDNLVYDLRDTLFLVGWKLGQPNRHPISSYAEQVAAHVILDEAQAALEMHADSLTEAAYKTAEGELQDADESILDPDWVYEELPAIDRLSLADVVPTGVPRRASLWAPYTPEAGDPAPHTTGDEEPVWTLTDDPGQSPSDATGADQQRLEAVRREAELPELFQRARWSTNSRSRHRGALRALRAELPDRKSLVLRLPDRTGDRNRRIAPWQLECFLEEGANKATQPEWSHPLMWERVFQLLPSETHPMAVDAIFAEIADAKDWATVLADRVLPGGAFDSLDVSVRLLEGIASLRDQLERCRQMGVVRDRRLTASGLRHSDFACTDRMRFEAIVRCALPDDSTFEEIRSDLGHLVVQLHSLPVSLELDPDTGPDGSVCIRCGFAVDSPDMAAVVANEVFSQVRWHLRLEPLDFRSGEGDLNTAFEIRERLKDGGW
jgi:hypothetical protein